MLRILLVLAEFSPSVESSKNSANLSFPLIFVVLRWSLEWTPRWLAPFARIFLRAYKYYLPSEALRWARLIDKWTIIKPISFLVMNTDAEFIVHYRIIPVSLFLEFNETIRRNEKPVVVTVFRSDSSWRCRGICTLELPPFSATWCFTLVSHYIVYVQPSFFLYSPRAGSFIFAHRDFHVDKFSGLRIREVCAKVSFW